MRGPTNPLYLLLILLGVTDALKVTMKTPLISVMRDVDVTIPCEFTPGKTINVGWNKTQNGETSEVYIYIPEKPRVFREGAYMEESEIKKGNATLYIPRVQYSDDGEYTCIVYVTPKKGEGKSVLQVSAVPSAVLIPGDDINVELGNEKVVSCEVSNFYPKNINIRWVRYEKDSSKCVALERGTCIGDSTNNTDGTFSVTSHLTLYPKTKDDSHRYSCVVKHRSLIEDLKRNFTLIVTEREDNTEIIITAVIVTILVIALLLLAGFLYYQVFTKDPPVLSEITGSDPLTDMISTTLTCHIANYKPDDLEISVGLKRRGEEMMRIIHTCHPHLEMDDNDGDGRVVIDMEQQRLMNGGVSHTQGPLQLEMTPVITTNRSGLLRYIPWRRLHTYSCQCSVHITPSYWKDDGAEFSVHVSHPALTAAISQKRTLQVKGVPPTLLKIVRPVIVTHEVPMTLTCPINGFKPKPLQITWLKKDQNDQETQIITWNSDDGSDTSNEIHKVTENELKDKSYSFLSAIMITPRVREDGVQYICRTHHPATNQQGDQELTLDVTAVPSLCHIRQIQDKGHPGDKIYAGNNMTLSCKIHSFYPSPIEVTWSTEDGRTLHSTISDILSDQSGLYQGTSSMTYPPTMKDKGKTFTCEVRHQSTGALRKKTWKLQDLVSELKVSDIRCSPSPQSGNMVTLSCNVTDLYPKDLVVTWHKGIARIPAENYSESIQEDPESGMFQGTVKMEFLADSGCHEEEYRMELIHCGKTIERKHILLLEDFSRSPALDDIISDPRDPRYGHPVTLSCKVTNAKPQDIKVMWLKGEKPLEKGREEKMIHEKDGSLSFSLRIIPTALDHGKVFTCSVIHKDMKEPLRKNYYIALPDKPPVFSDITVRPERPVAGKEAIFTVTISGFTPEIKVKWYKDFSTFPKDVFTTSDPQIGEDFLCTCISSLRFIPRDNDNMPPIRCEATHSVTKKVYEKQYTLDLTEGRKESPAESRPGPGRLKSPWKIREIQCLTENPRVGDPLTLMCYVNGCDANTAEFSWMKGAFPIDGDIENRNLEDGSGCFSRITFTAQETDRDCKITCEATYNLATKNEDFTLKLQ